MTKKKCIIFSQGPVPTPENTKVEGGGLRCWGLAQGIVANASDEVDVTVVYNDAYRQDVFTNKYQGIRIATWNMTTVPDVLKDYDTVIVSYCMGGLSQAVVNALRVDQQLILDCYVPIYVEASARESADVESEYRSFMGEVPVWASVLTRGDVFLCASEAQKAYYEGVLSAVGRINPATYGEDQILIVPYGVYKEVPEVTARPVTERLGNDVRKILWFGGIYPWFDLRELVKAVQKLNKEVPSRLMIVGARNPFNSHPDFVAKADELENFVKSDVELAELVAFQDWVSFDERANWYLDSDVVIVLNREGPENKLAWRTRLVDFMWADLPIATNGGDPLGEEMIATGAAIRLTSLRSDDIAHDLLSIFDSSESMATLHEGLKSLRKKYYWDEVTRGLARAIVDVRRANDAVLLGRYDTRQAPGSAGYKAKIARVAQKAKMLPAYARKYGMRNTYVAVKSVVERRVKRALGNRFGSTHPKAIFVAHQLDLSGAPFVFMDLIKDFRAQYPTYPIEVHTFNPTHADNIVALNAIGVKPQLHLSKDISIEIRKDDTIVLNTVAHSAVLREVIYNSLEKNIAKKLVWYIHEDDPELQFSEGERKRIQGLLDNDKAELFVVSAQASGNYRKFFKNSKNVHTQLYRFQLEKQYHVKRKASDFADMKFLLSGTVSDGRKGQLPVLYAFAEFKKRYYDAAPEKYRGFELVYVGVEGDFLSKQITNHSKKALGQHFMFYPKMSRAKVLDLVKQTNATICYSLRECLPLFVFEGMVAGHVVLRNDCSGIQEQLVEGGNGYYLDSKDFEQVIQTIEKLLNKEKTTNNELLEMSHRSYTMVKSYEVKDYNDIIGAILDKRKSRK